MEEKRNRIKKFILNNYGAEKEDRVKLSKFVDYLLNNYDIEDKLYEDIREDLEDEEDEQIDNLSFEISEYRYNVLGGNW